MVRIIPDEVLSRLATDTKVDYYSKVLSGERMFHLLLYAFCMTDRISQRRVETMFNSQQFKTPRRSGSSLRCGGSVLSDEPTPRHRRLLI
ncbi:MAG: hypothetical protein IKJ81_04935 [Bacteroidales bacterium]|nr:hypothetical protein [Bacteroidales bacterium]